MSKIVLLELIQQDIIDIKGLIEYYKCEQNNGSINVQARGILLNLQEHLEEFIKY